MYVHNNMTQDIAYQLQYVLEVCSCYPLVMDSIPL